ncbi:MAG: M50 family metallopeptidase [Lachnospiraceae bacterium]|nr:M50 family metallopeptidase [Lachnospiraceae bacterium]
MKTAKKNKYPRMANYVVIRRGKDGGITARNCIIGEEIELTEIQAGYLMSLNGKRDPFSIPGFTSKQCRELYELFDDMLMIRKKKHGNRVGLTFMLTLFVPKRLRATKSIIPKILNFLLMITFLPAFIMGIHSCLICENYISAEYEAVGLILSIVIGLLAHEFAHAIACISCKNGRFLEMGLMFNFFPGAYVILDDSRIKSRLAKIQINLAGIEMNLLISGVCLLIAYHPMFSSGVQSSFSGIFFMAAVENAILALINLLCVRGFDGEHVLSLLVGKSSLARDSAKVVKSLFAGPSINKLFGNSRHVSSNTFASVCTGVVVVCIQSILPIMLLFDVVCTIGELF